MYMCFFVIRVIASRNIAFQRDWGYELQKWTKHLSAWLKLYNTDIFTNIDFLKSDVLYPF